MDYRMRETHLVKIYYKPTCPYCVRALNLLNKKEGIRLQKIDITDNNDLREQMIKESSGTTVPQIFINYNHIGGCDDLMLLEKNDQLDKLLYE